MHTVVGLIRRSSVHAKPARQSDEEYPCVDEGVEEVDECFGHGGGILGG